MRVALFTDTYLPDVNGVVTSIELLRKELEKHGHDAYVVCTYPGVMKIKQEGKIIRLPGIEVALANIAVKLRLQISKRKTYADCLH